MKPNSSSPEAQNAGEVDINSATPDESTSLTRREMLGTLGVGVALAGITAAVTLFMSNREKANAGPSLPDHPRQLVDFTLIDRTGRTIRRADLNGKFLVVDFLFTSCSLTCPVINGWMAQIQQMTTNQADVLLVSLTVAPRDDTPEVLANYGKRFGADTNRWLMLTGEKDQLYGLIKTSFLDQDLKQSSDYMPGNFTRTDRIAVVDFRGVVRAYFDGLSADTPKAVVQEIAKLRKESL